MIRFLPDNWREALLRPVAMAAPDAGVYIEIMAPDLRFVFALALLALLAVFALRRRPLAPPRAALLLAAALAVAFVPWMLTTANGRYFLPVLLAVGPLCVGLLWLLPLTRGFRLAIALLLLALQGFAVREANPLQAWGLATWKEPPYFQLELPADLRTEPATYVTMSTISYSLVAPQFPAASRWISIATAPPPGADTLAGRRVQELFTEPPGGRLVLFIPIVPGTLTPQKLPNAEVSTIIDRQLASHRLGFAGPQPCRFVPSRGISSMAIGEQFRDKPSWAGEFGFWACTLRYLGPATAPQEQPVPSAHEAVYRRMEAACPRLFPPGQSGAQRIPGGELRYYPEADMRAYVLDTGVVYYKYYRAFNPVRIGTVDDILAGKVNVDCERIRGRSGLPWEREI